MAKQLLSKSQRHTAYIILLAELESSPEKIGGSRYEKWKRQLCQMIFKVFGIDSRGVVGTFKGDWFWEQSHSYSIQTSLVHFPELLKKKPPSGWPEVSSESVNLRKKWLQECINETYNF